MAILGFTSSVTRSDGDRFLWTGLGTLQRCMECTVSQWDE